MRQVIIYPGEDGYWIVRPLQSRCTLSLAFRGFHPRLRTVCPSGATHPVTPVLGFEVAPTVAIPARIS